MNSSSAAKVMLTIGLALLVTTSRALSDDARPSRDERDPRVIMEAVHRAAGEGSPRAGRMRLTTTPSSGPKRERVLQLRYKGDASARRSLLLVESPENVRGTGFVSIEFARGQPGAERWLYLANLKRSTRIAGGQMSGSFMGSDLSFTDLSQPDPARFDFTMVKENELVGGDDCWVIRAKAKDPKTQEESGYEEVQFWISKPKLSVMRMRAPLIGGKATKYMEGSDFMQIERFWTPKRLVVRVVENGKIRSESVLEALELKSDPSVTDADFTKQRLELGL